MRLHRRRPPSCVGPIAVAQATFVDRCGKRDDCTTHSTYSVWFTCHAALHGDILEVTRDKPRLDPMDGVDIEPPRPDACDALPTSGTHTLSF